MPNRVPMFRRAAALAFCGVLALSACGGEEAAKPKPLPTIPGVSDNGGADVAQPSDGGGDGNDGDATAAPAIPAPDPADYPGMDENTPEGAEQAFRYYIATWVWSNQAGDGTPLTAMSGDGCEACEELSRRSSQRASKNDLWSRAAVSDFRVRSESSPHFDAGVEYLFTVSPHEELDDASGKRIRVPALEYRAAAEMNWIDGRWVVSVLGMRWAPDVFKN